jgi:ferritin-like metal-binding protein YciE
MAGGSGPETNLAAARFSHFLFLLNVERAIGIGLRTVDLHPDRFYWPKPDCFRDFNGRVFHRSGRKQTDLPKENTMTMDTLQELYLEQLQDVYDAEKQLVKALPKMAKTATNDELKAAFEQHLEQTEEHVSRLERIFEELGEKPKGKKCKAMQGLIEEGKEMMEEDASQEVMDAGLICAAQKVEHYEIASYGCLRTYAEMLGFDDQADLLQETLDEEKDTDENLTELAVSCINLEAEEGEEEEEEEGEEQAPARGKAK